MVKNVFGSLLLSSAAVLFATTSVKSFEHECNYVRMGLFAYPVDVCMYQYSTTTGRMEGLRFRCADTSTAVLDRWNNVLDCEGFPNDNFTMQEMADEYSMSILDIGWKCDGSKSIEQCSYAQVGSYQGNQTGCMDIINYAEMAWLDNVCVADWESDYAYTTQCTGTDQVKLTYYNDIYCKSSMGVGYIETGCTLGSAYGYDVNCVHCQENCEVEPDTTTTSVGSKNCGYAMVDGMAHGLYHCSVRQSSNFSASYSQQFVCIHDQLVLLRWWYSQDCTDGGVNYYYLDQIASMYGTSINEISWNCGTTNSDDDCSYTAMRIYDPSGGCLEEDYTESIMLNGVCVSQGGLSLETSCEEAGTHDILNVKIYGDNCQGDSQSAAITTGCNSGVKYKIDCVGTTPYSTTKLSSTKISTTSVSRSKCSYVEAAIPFAVNKCMSNVTKHETYSFMFKCDEDSSSPILQRWSNSETCDGKPTRTYGTSEIADQLGYSDDISWKCTTGTKTCDYTHSYIYDVSSCDEENYYEETYILNYACVRVEDSDVWVMTACDDNELTLLFYEDSKCLDIVGNYTIPTYCYDDGFGDTYKYEFFCETGKEIGSNDDGDDGDDGDGTVSSSYSFVRSQIWCVVILSISWMFSSIAF